MPGSPGQDVAVADELAVVAGAAHTARDWLAKLHLVAAGCGITTVPAALAPAAPPGVRILPVRGGPTEQRRILLAWLPHPLADPAARVADALRTAALDA
ncbi:MAG: LysR substrate-binding domain-containing protein [Streptosporangiaceae bacterium]